MQTRRSACSKEACSKEVQHDHDIDLSNAEPIVGEVEDRAPLVANEEFPMNRIWTQELWMQRCEEANANSIRFRLVYACLVRGSCEIRWFCNDEWTFCVRILAMYDTGGRETYVYCT